MPFYFPVYAKAIVPPQKDGEQEVSGQKDPASSSRKQPPASPEPTEKLTIELLPEDPEALEIIIDEELPDDSLEEQALDEIWNRAVKEGTRGERTCVCFKCGPARPSGIASKSRAGGFEGIDRGG